MINMLDHLDEAFRAIGQIYWLIFINKTNSYFYPYNEEPLPLELHKFIMDEHTIFVKNLGKFHKLGLRIIIENEEFEELYKKLNNFHDSIVYALNVKSQKIEVDIETYNGKFPDLYDYYHEILEYKNNFEKIAHDYLIAK